MLADDRIAVPRVLNHMQTYEELSETLINQTEWLLQNSYLCDRNLRNQQEQEIQSLLKRIDFLTNEIQMLKLEKV